MTGRAATIRHPDSDQGVRFPYNRARTAVVQCRSHLIRAEQEILLALQIVASPDRRPEWSPDLAFPDQLESFLERLRATQRALTRAWGPLGPTRRP